MLLEVTSLKLSLTMNANRVA